MNREVEIKFLLSGSVAEQAEHTFGLVGREPDTLRVAFFDTPDLALFNGGLLMTNPALTVILRARFKNSENKGTSTLKFRMVGALPIEWVTDEAADTKRELDYSFDNTSPDKPASDSFSVNAKVRSDDFNLALQVGGNIKDVFADPQRDRLKVEANGDFHWHNLRAFGPVDGVLVWKHVPLGPTGLEATFERWILPSRGTIVGKRLLEVSTRAAEPELESTKAKVLALLQSKRLNPESFGSKTKLVLEQYR